MLKSKVENIILGNQYLSIEIFTDKETVKTCGIIVEKSKGNLTVLDSLKTSNIEEFYFQNKNNIAVVLTISTNKVLIKESELQEKNDLILVKKNFPNINLEDFYFDIWRFENKSIISLARKNYVDETIKLFKEKGIIINHVNLGISNIKNIIEYINDEIIYLSNKSFNKSNKSISESDSIVSKIYSVNGINLKNEQLTPFSSILNFMSKTKNGSIDELNTNLNNTFFQNTFFKKYVKFFIFFILGVLLINFIFFNHYYNKFHERSILNTTEIENKEKLENLKRLIIDKEKSVNELSLSNTRRISFILNEIGKSVPNTIILNELHFQPLLKKGNTETLTKYSEKNISVSGISNNNTAFTNWIEKLSTFKNFNEVVILKFEKEDNTTSFKINIFIK